MKPLVTNQKVLIWLYLCAVDDVSLRTNLAHIALGATAFLLLILGNVASVLFVLKFVSVDLKLSLFALYQIFAISSILYLMIAAFILRHKIHDIFAMLQEIYCESK